MAALDFNATGAPTDVVAALNLSTGTRYTGQNISTVATLFVRESASVVTPPDRGFKVEAGGSFQIKVAADPIYLWTDDTQCPVVLDEAS